MKVTFYVNAMVLLESKKSRVLCDPWVTFDTQSISGFYGFPKPTFTREEVAAIKPDFIYITHTHPDHFDPPTLRLFDRSTPILVAPYVQNFTERMARSLGFTDVRVVPLETGAPLNGDDRIWIEPAAVYPEVDSIALFRLDGEMAVNANDNVFSESQCVHLRELAGRIDVALLPSGAHGPFPMFFENLTDDEKRGAATKRAAAQKNAFVKYIHALQPKYVVPIAGGIICGGAKVRQYVYSGIRPRSEVIDAALKQVQFKPAMVSERCAFDSATGKVTGTYVEKSFESEEGYLDELAAQPSLFGAEGRFHIAPDQRVDLSRLLANARKNQKRWQERHNITSQSRYYFDVGDERLYGLSLADEEVRRVRQEDLPENEEYEIYRLPYELLVGLLTRHYIWSNANTQHMWFYRNMPKVDPGLLLLMNYLQV